MSLSLFDIMRTNLYWRAHYFLIGTLGYWKIILIHHDWWYMYILLMWGSYSIQIFEYLSLWKDSVPPCRSINVTLGPHYLRRVCVTNMPHPRSPFQHCICCATKESLGTLDHSGLGKDIDVYSCRMSLDASQERSLNTAYSQVCWEEIQMPPAPEIILATSTVEAAWRQTI